MSYSFLDQARQFQYWEKLQARIRRTVLTGYVVSHYLLRSPGFTPMPSTSEPLFVQIMWVPGIIGHFSPYPHMILLGLILKQKCHLLLTLTPRQDTIEYLHWFDDYNC